MLVFYAIVLCLPEDGNLSKHVGEFMCMDVLHYVSCVHLLVYMNDYGMCDYGPP